MQSPQSLLPPKRDVLLAFLGRGTLRVFVDARREGVTVPRNLARQAELVLRIGRSLNPAIPDLEIGDDAVTCTLSFSRIPHWCRLPFDSIYAVVSDSDGRGVVWPDDVPLESQLIESSPSSTSREASPKPARTRRARIAEAGSSEAEGKQPAAREGSTASRRRARIGGAAPRSTTDEARATGDVPRATLDEVIARSGAPERAPQLSASSSPADGRSDAEPRSRRTLPPYLRVVK
jgi:stringent starvation protein B